MNTPKNDTELAVGDGKIAARNGNTIAYSIRGNGPWITFLHALMGNGNFWRDQVSQLSHHFTVLTIDLRGHGDSDAPAGPYTMDAMADDVVDVLDGLGVMRTHLVGASMGGLVAQSVAARYADRIGQLVLANTTYRYGPEHHAGWEARITTVMQSGLAAVIPGTLARFLTDVFRDVHPEAVSALGKQMERTSAAGFISCCKALDGADIGAYHGMIKAPTLLIAGKKDPATTVEVMADLQSRIIGANLVTLDSAHLSNVEQPEKFTEALKEFFLQ
ncbi:alpha/beta fold hydrolase [Paraburkholderia sp.]|uniref:alpha/beta fold hydrolase n=1 Tax=Paraburkholderia sp. TaxID=1926495 RepID=UPI0039E55303